MRTITIRSDSYHHWPVAPTPFMRIKVSVVMSKFMVMFRIFMILMMTMLIIMRPITIESDSYHHWPAAPSTPFMNIKVFYKMFNMMTVMIMTTKMMRMITIESDSYHHWPAARTPHPTPFPLMSIHSNQRVGMITLTMAMV